MKPNTDEIVGMMIEAAGRLAQLVANASFEFWQRKDFRLYVDFEKLTQTEQDRIFNELEVSLLGLFLLYFDNAMLSLEKPEKMVLSVFQKELTPAFLKIMEDAGLEKEFVKQWEKLIDLRLKEYREDFAIALKESKKEAELKDDELLQIPWSCIQTITIDCLRHLRRGNVKDKDPLWDLLRKWFTMQYAQLQPLAQMAHQKKKN